MKFRDFSRIFGAVSPRRSRPPEACSPLKVIPDRGPAARRFFFTKMIKINDFNVKIINFKGFQTFLLSKFVIKHDRFHENSFFDQNLIKKKNYEKIFFWWKKIIFWIFKKNIIVNFWTKNKKGPKRPNGLSILMPWLLDFNVF